MTFKIGDKVKVISVEDFKPEYRNEVDNKDGIVVEVYPTGVFIEFTHNKIPYFFKPGHLKLLLDNSEAK